MERNPIVEAQLTFQEEETKLWEGIEEYRRSFVRSQDPVTGIVQPTLSILPFILQRRRPFFLQIQVL